MFFGAQHFSPAVGILTWEYLWKKLVTGAGEPLEGRLLLFEGLAGAARTVSLAADPACPVCA